MLCESSESCPHREACLHARPHDELNDPENSCSAPCDVFGGVPNSKCKEELTEL